MKVKDLEDLRTSLNKIIDKAKDSKKDIALIELEKTAFHKFQRYVAGGETIARREVDGKIDKVEKARALKILAARIFIKDQLKIFIEHEIQDERDKINFN